MKPVFDPQPVVLRGRYVRLEPLSQTHAADIEQLIAEAEAEMASGAQIPFAIVHARSGAAIGSTRYLDLRPGHREGMLRRSFILRDGFVRDSVYFSIVDDEWPAVKQRLLSMLGTPSGETSP